MTKEQALKQARLALISLPEVGDMTVDDFRIVQEGYALALVNYNKELIGSFEWALSLHKQGENVRRRSWIDGEYWGQPMFKGEYIEIRNYNKDLFDFILAHFTYRDILADDWEHVSKSGKKLIT